MNELALGIKSVEELDAAVDDVKRHYEEGDPQKMHDSGEREQFDTGAVRDVDKDKPRPGLISPFAMRRLGRWLAIGAEKYTDRNWEKGIPLSRTTESLYRHLLDWQAGDTTEDHLAAIMCNAMFLIHTQEMVGCGQLPESLSDMPDYLVECEEHRDDRGGER